MRIFTLITFYIVHLYSRRMHREDKLVNLQTAYLIRNEKQWIVRIDITVKHKVNNLIFVTMIRLNTRLLTIINIV